MTHATGTSEQSIPHGPTDPTLPVQEYQISVDTTDGFLNFYFSVAPDDFSPTKDQPLEFRVPPAGPCCITIQLDPNLNWEFRYKVGDPIMLASPNNPPDGPAANRYSQLNWGFAANGKCQTVSFDATVYGGTALPNRDQINIYLNLDQHMADGSIARPLAIVVDPDIQNPGDDTG
jgi:hypothetical protein